MKIENCMKKNKYIGVMVLAAGMLATASCSDFDDYNKVVADEEVQSANLTLWENIEQNQQLTDFASLVRRVGFDKELNQTRYYTVCLVVACLRHAEGCLSVCLTLRTANGVAPFGRDPTCLVWG